MLNIIKKYPRAFALAVLGHIIMASLFAVSFEWTHTPQVQPEVNVVQATAVNEKQVLAELEKLQAIEDKKRKAEQDRLSQLERQADKAKEAREREQQRLKEVEAERKQESVKKAEAEKQRKVAESEAKKATERTRALEAEQRKAAEAQKLAEKKAREADDARKKLEEERARAEDVARKAKEEAVKALEAQRRADEDRMRQELLAEELKREDAARAKKEMTVVQQYTAMILEKINVSWLIPPTAKKGMFCIVSMRLMPTGDVLSFSIIKSSGDSIFDRSVETAVRKAVPLPLPPDKALFRHFREIELRIEPKI